MTNDDLNLDELAMQYFSDLREDGRADTEDNMVSWLWFTCPANLREDVVAKIESLRECSPTMDRVG